MVHCVVAGCQQKTGKPSGVSFFNFPDQIKNKELWMTWRVRINRSGSNSASGKKQLAAGGEELWEPTRHSHVCSDHFTPDCFTKDPRISASIGYKDRFLRLIKNAVPTVFPVLRRSTPDKQNVAVTHGCGGFLKRERKRVGRHTWACQHVKHTSKAFVYMYLHIIIAHTLYFSCYIQVGLHRFCINKRYILMEFTL